jgi:hypothetical protein
MTEEYIVRRRWRDILKARKVRRPNGRPMHERTEQSIAQVKTLAIAGVRQELIARVLGISVPTLTKHYREELDLATVQANAAVARNLYSKATGNGPNSITAAIFWLKCRAGWKDTSTIEHTGLNGAPIEIQSSKKLSPEDEDKMRKALEGRV